MPMGATRGWRVIGGAALVLAQVQLWAWLGLVLPGCDATTGCAQREDCGPGDVCDAQTHACVPLGSVDSGPPAPEPQPGPGSGPGSGLLHECAVEPSRGHVPIRVSLSATVPLVPETVGTRVHWE